ncbi:MAG: flavodoxin [Acetomicrobium sp.]
MNGKILIAYFSHSGSTREVARQIHELIDSDIFEIVTVNPYPSDYDQTVVIGRQELNSGKMPELKAKVKDIDSYDIIFVGYPIWFGTIPMAVARFLSDCNLSGKTVIPFCTHGGGGAGRSFSDVKKLCPNSTVQEGLSLKGSEARNAKPKISEWLHKVGITEQNT